MEAPQLTTAEKSALLALIDDVSPPVRHALLAHFTRLGEAGRAVLQEAAQSEDPTIATSAVWFQRELRFSDPVAEFRGFIQSQNYELETGALLLGRTLNPRLDVAAVCTQLDAFATRARKLMTKTVSLKEQCAVLNRVLFDEYGLRGNHEDYADPQNSALDQVLRRRVGIPISLSLVYLFVAERIGVELEPVGVPGHFLVGGYGPLGPFFIDPFNAGMFLAPEDVFERLRSLGHTPQLADLAPTPVREVLCRACRNLARHFLAAEDHANAKLFSSFVNDFDAAYDWHAGS
ncbi:MAG: transglutaminase-like domain-containing protein [Candidatus Didemnitutus sp.]|nr:transglutaminase-like domain-containing protein [Candidatus Didemnitutus sp.]